MKWQGREVRLLGRWRERRSYAKTLVDLLLAQGEGSAVNSDALATGSLEIAGRCYADALAAARVRPEEAAAVITPDVLAGIGRNLIRTGRRFT